METYKEYKKGRITLTELAENTKKDVWEMMDILKQRKIESSLAMDDLKDAAGLFTK